VPSRRASGIKRGRIARHYASASRDLHFAATRLLALAWTAGVRTISHALFIAASLRTAPRPFAAAPAAAHARTARIAYRFYAATCCIKARCSRAARACRLLLT